MSVAVTGWNDRQMINACLLYRFSMSYEPRDFHGELDEMPETLKYGHTVDDLRYRYRNWLWDAEFRDTIGAKVTRDGETLDTFTVFRRNDGLHAVVFVNMSDTEGNEIEPTVFIDYTKLSPNALKEVLNVTKTSSAP